MSRTSAGAVKEEREGKSSLAHNDQTGVSCSAYLPPSLPRPRPPPQPRIGRVMDWNDNWKERTMDDAAINSKVAIAVAIRAAHAATEGGHASKRHRGNERAEPLFRSTRL